MYVVPPMAEEPPPEFVTFVAVHLAALRSEASRLTGGARHGDEVYPQALCDVALHWRRLRLRRRLTGRDEVGAYLAEHPEAMTAVGAAITHPIPASYATLAYNSLHAFGFVMLLTLIAVVTFADTKVLFNGPAESGSAAPAKTPPPKP